MGGASDFFFFVGGEILKWTAVDARDIWSLLICAAFLCIVPTDSESPSPAARARAYKNLQDKNFTVDYWNRKKVIEGDKDQCIRNRTWETGSPEYNSEPDLWVDDMKDLFYII